jgi:type II secretory pathway pseudopilin PulG
MKFSNADFYQVRWNLLAILTAILLSSLILYSSTQYAQITQKNQRIAQSQLNDARNQFAMATQDQASLADFSKEYDTLEKNKIIGDDHRLDWMEGLEKIRNQNHVVDFRYSIAPQKIYAPQPAIDSGNFDIHYSEMKLQFDLRHEGQLLDFFDALRSQIQGHYQLESCTVQRDDAAEDAGTPMHLKGECNGGWITLKNRNVQ